MSKLNLKQKFLAEIFKAKFMVFRGPLNSRGTVLIMAILILDIMLVLGAYFISFSLTGSKMTQSHAVSTGAYYLAEAGIQEAIFKLQNDATWKSAFETPPTLADPTCSSWSIAPYSRNPALVAGGSYDITITNLGCAKAEIASQAKIQLGSGTVAQKIVKTKVFKALGNPVSEFNIFTGGASENLEISSTNPLNVYGGSLFSNNNIRIKNSSNVTVENKALAEGNILISDSSQLNATSCASNICEAGCATSTDCPPAGVTMPPLNFDEGPNSYLSYAEGGDCASIRADGKTNCVFTPAEFEKVMWNHYPTLSLPSNVVVYITGDFNLRAGQDLTVNGTLLADRDVNLGQDLCWTSSEPPFVRCGSSRLKVVRPGVPSDNLPAGILAKRKFNTGIWLAIGGKALDVNGLIYSGDEMRFSSMTAFIEVHGALVGRKVSFSSMWGGVDIYLEPDVIVDTFKDAEYSPVITIDHWEEKY